MKALTGDMGESFKFRTDVLGLVLGRLPNTARDLPVTRAAVLIVALFIVLINLAVDLLYPLLDPPIKLGACLE
jgi:peptide/nickel transport system permease protein